MPSPDVLERLEPMAPGVTKKMLEWAESEQKHRQLMDRMVVKRSITLEYFRLSLAFFAVLTVFGTGVYFMTNGHETCGTTIITTTAVALVVAFVSARKKDAEQERGQ